MIKAINNQRNTEKWMKDKGQFIPMPFTWLNQRRWEDEIKDDCSTVDLMDETNSFSDAELKKEIDDLSF